VQIGQLTNPNYPPFGFAGVAVARDVVYLSYLTPLETQILDAADPSQLHVIGSFAGTRALETIGKRLFSSDGRAWDVSNPGSPVLMGALRTDLAPELAMSGTATYTIDAGTFAVVDFGPEYEDARGVAVDLNPGDDTNRVVITEPGAMLMAMLGSADFDASELDLDSMRAGKGGAAPLASFLYDWNEDGWLDASAIYWIPEAGIAITDSEICVEAVSRDGTPVSGCDAIVPIAGCGDGFALALLLPLALPLLRGRRIRIRA
jgi:hypothetical protein